MDELLLPQSLLPGAAIFQLALPVTPGKKEGEKSLPLPFANVQENVHVGHAKLYAL